MLTHEGTGIQEVSEQIVKQINEPQKLYKWGGLVYGGRNRGSTAYLSEAVAEECMEELAATGAIWITPHSEHPMEVTVEYAVGAALRTGYPCVVVLGPGLVVEYTIPV